RFPDHPTLPGSREIVAGLPALRFVLRPEIELVRLESLKLHRSITKILVSDGVEIIVTNVGVEVRAPEVRHTLVGDGSARDHLRHPVRPRAERRFKRTFGDVA